MISANKEKFQEFSREKTENFQKIEKIIKNFKKMVKKFTLRLEWKRRWRLQIWSLKSNNFSENWPFLTLIKILELLLTILFFQMNSLLCARRAALTVRIVLAFISRKYLLQITWRSYVKILRKIEAYTVGCHFNAPRFNAHFFGKKCL